MNSMLNAALALCIISTAYLVHVSLKLHEARAQLIATQRSYSDLQYGYDQLDAIAATYLQQLRTCGMTGAEPMPYRVEIGLRQ